MKALQDLAEAAKIINELQYQVFLEYGKQASAPWRKLIHAGHYLQDRQDEELRAILEPPPPVPLWRKALSKLFS